jgi:hypothetical protein
MSLKAAALDAIRFTDEQCDALFAAILVDDSVDPHTELPVTIPLDYTERQLTECFCLCRQLWKTGVDQAELIDLMRKLARDRDLSPDDRLRFKHARAKYKHLRFAYALYDAKHRYPVVMNWVTTAMGHLQDAFKNGHAAAVWRQATLSRFFLTPAPHHLLMREVDSFTPSDGADFRRYVERQIGILRSVLDRPTVTGEQFHATRKIISRQVAFYGNLQTLWPSTDSYGILRSLAAINGLMGGMHDELVERRIAGTQDYRREQFALPEEIAQRLTALVMRYPR